MTQAKYIETFAGYDYFRDEHGNVYAKIGEEIMFCSNHKRGQLTEDKAEPSYPVHINELIRNKDERMVVLAEIEELVKEVCGDE